MGAQWSLLFRWEIDSIGYGDSGKTSDPFVGVLW